MAEIDSSKSWNSWTRITQADLEEQSLCAGELITLAPSVES